MKFKHIFFSLAAMAIFSTAQAQVKVGANPGTIGTNSALEVEATNGQKVIVNKTTGQMTIQHRPAGAAMDSLLTVDGSGNVRAVASPSVNPTNVYILARQAASQNFPNNFNLANPIVVAMTDEVEDTHNAWNTGTSTFTAPEDGFYNIQFSFVLEYDGTAIYAHQGDLGVGYMAVGLRKTAGTYTGPASLNNGQYRSFFQGSDSPFNQGGSNIISPNPGGGVISLTLSFKKGEQLQCNVSQANGRYLTLTSPSYLFTNNFVSITKM